MSRIRREKLAEAIGDKVEQESIATPSPDDLVTITIRREQGDMIRSLLRQNVGARGVDFMRPIVDLDDILAEAGFKAPPQPPTPQAA